MVIYFLSKFVKIEKEIVVVLLWLKVSLIPQFSKCDISSDLSDLYIWRSL